MTTGRTLEQVAEAGGRVWRSGAAEGGGSPAGRAPDPSSLPGARKATLPGWVGPELARLVTRPPEGDGWLHEIKLDGYRVLARVHGGEARLFTRNGQDWTDRFGSLADALVKLPVAGALFDGEVVVIRPDGRTSFQALQQALGDGRKGPLVYYLFDLLHLDGYDLRGVPLEERKRVLRQLLPFPAPGPLRASEHVVGRGAVFLEEACRLGLEGMVSKRRDSRYRGRRGRDWLKVKCRHEQEFVIGGFTDPSGSRVGFGALLLGVHERAGLRYVGKVGTGFDRATLRSLRARLDDIRRSAAPFRDPPRARHVQWVEPSLVAEVAFTEWTEEGAVRHPAFQGLREDVDPASVTRESASGAPVFGEAAGRRGGGLAGGDRADPAAGIVEEVRLHGVRLTHPGRVLYAAQGLSKLDLARYYETVAERMVPLIRRRPLLLLRCPEGTSGPCFYQKHASNPAPRHVGLVTLPEKERSADYMYVSSPAGILSLLNLGALELHDWGARIDRVERPDRLVFDLDPDVELEFAAVVELGLAVRDRLAELGLRSFAKTTGGKGLHVVVPLMRRSGWEEVSAFARAFAERIAESDPARYTTTMSKAKRKGRIYIDYLRNVRGATAVAAYSTRARAGAPVSAPIGWEELKRETRPDRWTAENMWERLGRGAADPWADYGSTRQALTNRARRAVGAT